MINDSNTFKLINDFYKIIQDSCSDIKEKVAAYGNSYYLEPETICFKEFQGIRLNMPTCIFDNIVFFKINEGEERAFQEFWSFYYPYVSKEWAKNFIKSKNIPGKEDIKKQEKEFFNLINKIFNNGLTNDD